MRELKPFLKMKEKIIEMLCEAEEFLREDNYIGFNGNLNLIVVKIHDMRCTMNKQFLKSEQNENERKD